MQNLETRRQAERRGRRSETIAAAFLIVKGYRILGRRVRTHAGEIDLVARAPCGLICFVEVKQRADARAAAESVIPRQQARIARAASVYLAKRPALAQKGVRFDIVAVGPFLRHFRDAFRADDWPNDWRRGAA